VLDALLAPRNKTFSIHVSRHSQTSSAYQRRASNSEEKKRSQCPPRSSRVVFASRDVTDDYKPTVDRTQLMRNVKGAWKKIPTAVINEFVRSFESKLKRAVAAGGR
jgi:hypothetical protein